MRTTLVLLITYEPVFELNGKNQALLDYYRANFDYFADPVDAGKVTFCISDFGSSPAFKTFLRTYVKEKRWYLVDCPQEAPIIFAINSAIRQFQSDFVVYAASDVRHRDRLWLSHLLADAEDSNVGMVQTTVTIDGYFFQTQKEPLDLPSRTIVFPEVLTMHCILFRRSFFEAFDNRFPDIFDTWYLEYCLLYAMAALGLQTKMSYRVNLIHNRFHGGGRHRRTEASNYNVRHKTVERDTHKWKVLQYYLPIGRFRQTPIDYRNLKQLYQELRYHLVCTKREGWRYWFYKLARRTWYENFGQLDKEARIVMIRALFLRPLRDYEKYRFEVYQPEEAPLLK